jgi:uncharacterized protein
MIGRRLLGIAAAAMAASSAQAQVKWYAGGTKERLVRFAGAGGVPLSGTLLLPLVSEIQYVPGVVLIAGSGPTDRNGNNPLVPARIDSLKLIAERLARARIASLRFDKRGIGASTPSPQRLEEQERFFAWDNLVADVQAAHAELLRHDEIKSYATALLGHSEGGVLTLAAAATMKARPYGLVLASTPGWPLEEIVRRQIARTAPNFLAAAEQVMAAIRVTGRAPADVPRDLAALFPPYIGPFLQGALAFDPAKALAAIDTACLLVHGAADTQIVPLNDIQPLLDVLSKRSGSGEAFVAPAVSHNLKTVSGPGDPGFVGPLAPAVGEKLASWLGFVLGA